MITINVNSLNTAMKRQRLFILDKMARSNFMLSERSQTQVPQGIGRKGISTEFGGTFLRDVNLLYLDCGGDYKIIHMC